MFSTSWIENKASILEETHKYDKSIKLYTKDNFFSKSIAFILWFISYVFTFGKRAFPKDAFLTQYATTIGPFHFYPKEWESYDVMNVLPHEAQHTKQARALSLYIHPIIGILPMSLMYLLPIPIGLALGRLWLEINADKAIWEYIVKTRAPQTANQKENLILEIKMRSKSFVYCLSSEDYMWTVPKRLALWYTNKEVKKFLKKKGL